MKVLFLLPWLMTTALLCCGCTAQSSFAMLSNKRLALTRITAEKLQLTVPVSAQSRCILLLQILPLSLCSLDDALDTALAEGGGDLLVDATITKYQYNIILLNYWSWTVTGKAARTQ